MAARRRPRKRTLLALAGVGLLAAAAFLWLTLPDVRPLREAPPQTTTMIDLRKRQAEEAGRHFALHWTWRPLGRISSLLQRAVIYCEDAEFFRHGGVDWVAMKEAAAHDLAERSLERGASTITQQVAKNLFLSPSRNPIRKVREILIAGRLERDLTKARILEIYLNIAEWGDGVFGAEAAARRWFGKSAASLDAWQAARLALALPNPFKRSPGVRSAALDKRAGRLVRAFVRAGLVPPEMAPPAQAAPSPTPEPTATSREASPAAPDDLPEEVLDEPSEP